MTLKHRLDKLERRLRNFDGACKNHRITCVIMHDQPMPEKSAISPCPNCGQPGTVLVIKEVIVPGHPS